LKNCSSGGVVAKPILDFRREAKVMRFTNLVTGGPVFPIFFGGPAVGQVELLGNGCRAPLVGPSVRKIVQWKKDRIAVEHDFVAGLILVVATGETGIVIGCARLIGVGSLPAGCHELLTFVGESVDEIAAAIVKQHDV